MTQHVVLGIEGDPRLLVVDTVNMAVQAIDPSELGEFGGLENLRTLAAGREAGEHRQQPASQQRGGGGHRAAYARGSN